MQSSRGGKPRGPGRRKTLPNPLTTTGLPSDAADNVAGSTTPIQSPKHTTASSRTPQTVAQDKRGSRPKSRPPSSSLSEAQKPFSSTTGAAAGTTTTNSTATTAATPSLAAKKRARSEFLDGSDEQQPEDSNQKGGHSLRKRARVDYSFEYLVDEGVGPRAKAMPTVGSVRGRKRRIDSAADDGTLSLTPSKRRAGGGVDGSPRRKTAPRKVEHASSYADTGDDNDVKDTIEVGGRKSQPIEEPEFPEVKVEEPSQASQPSQTQEPAEASQPPGTQETTVVSESRTPEASQAHEVGYYGYQLTETPRQSREPSLDKSAIGPQPISTNDNNEVARTKSSEPEQAATADVQEHEATPNADAAIPNKPSDEAEPLDQADTIAAPAQMEATVPDHVPPAHSPPRGSAIPEESPASAQTSAPQGSVELGPPSPAAEAENSLEGAVHDSEKSAGPQHPEPQGPVDESVDGKVGEERDSEVRGESPQPTGPTSEPQRPSSSEPGSGVPQDTSGQSDGDRNASPNRIAGYVFSMYQVPERQSNGEAASSELEKEAPEGRESETDDIDRHQSSPLPLQIGSLQFLREDLEAEPQEPSERTASEPVGQDTTEQGDAEHSGRENVEPVGSPVGSDEVVPPQVQKDVAEEAPIPDSGSPSPESIAKDSTSENVPPEQAVSEDQESHVPQDAAPGPSRNASLSPDLHERQPMKSEEIEVPEETKDSRESDELNESKEGETQVPVPTSRDTSRQETGHDVEMASVDQPSEGDKEVSASQDSQGAEAQAPSPGARSSPGLLAESVAPRDDTQKSAIEDEVTETVESSTAPADTVNGPEDSVAQDAEDVVAQDTVTQDTVAQDTVVQDAANAVVATDDVAHDAVADDQDTMMEEDVEDAATQDTAQDANPQDATTLDTLHQEPAVSSQETVEASEPDVIVESPKPIKPWSHLTLYLDGQYVLHPESRLPNAGLGGSINGTVNGTGASTPTIKGPTGEVINGEEEAEVAPEADEDADEPIESGAVSPRQDASAVGSPIPELNDAVAASSPEPLDEDEEAAEAEVEAEAGDETPPETQEDHEEAAPRFFKYPQLRDPDEFHDVLQNYKDMSDEDLYEMCAFVADKLVDLQNDYLKLGAVVDDHENVARRRAHDDANEQLERQGNRVSRKTFVLKGYRARMTREEKETAYLRQQDRIQAAAYGFRYDAHQSKIGKQDPLAQRPFQDREDGGASGPRRTLRSDPSRTAKATEAADEPGVMGGPMPAVVGKRVRKPRELFDPATASRSATPVQAPRRRGRQPKVEASEEQDPGVSFASSNGVINGAEPAVPEKPRRGRKRRVTVDEQPPAPEPPAEEEEPAPPPPKRVRRATNKAQQAAGESNGYAPNHHTIPRTVVTATSSPEDDAQGEEEDHTPRRIVTLKTSAKNFRALSNAPSAASTEPHTEAEQEESSRPGSSSSAASDATADSSYSARPKRQRKRGRPAADPDEHEAEQTKSKRARRVTKKAEESTANKSLQLPSIHNRASNATSNTTGNASGSPPQQVSATKPRIKLKTHYGGTNGAGVVPAAVPDAPAPAQAQAPSGKAGKKTPSKKAAGTTGAGSASAAKAAQRKVDDALAAAQANMSVKDYAALSKSEKMSHSMKSRWASGSMQQAVDKRKATLAKKKAAKVAAIGSAPDSAVGSPVDQDAAAASTSASASATASASAGKAGDATPQTNAHAPSAPPHQGYSFVLKDVRGPSKGGKGKVKGSH